MPDLSHGDRVQLAHLIVVLLDSWEVEEQDQIRLLALPAETTSADLRGYYDGTPLPASAETDVRVEHLIGIADALRTSWPHNSHMGAIWMNRRNDRFDNRTPLSVLLEDGLAGFFAIRTHLDCAYDWDISGSRIRS